MPVSLAGIIFSLLFFFFFFNSPKHLTQVLNYLFTKFHLTFHVLAFWSFHPTVCFNHNQENHHFLVKQKNELLFTCTGWNDPRTQTLLITKPGKRCNNQILLLWAFDHSVTEHTQLQRDSLGGPALHGGIYEKYTEVPLVQ